MVGTSLKQQLNNFIRSMHDQGILDQNFENVRALQNEENPRFVTEVILMFMNDAETAIREVAAHLTEPLVDYDQLIGPVHQLRGSSSSIGGCRMALACCELRHACDDKDKARCLELYQRVREEYRSLHENLNHICVLERSVLEYESRRKRGK